MQGTMTLIDELYMIEYSILEQDFWRWVYSLAMEDIDWLNEDSWSTFWSF